MVPEMTDELLRQGIAAAKAGRKEEALRLLVQVTETDERNERAWLWLSQVVDSAEEKAVCLENVLAINPDNAGARAGLDWLARQGVSITPPDLVSPDTPEATGEEEPCPRCGGVVSLAENTCPHCGLPMVVVCPGCRSHVEVGESSCPQCGYAIGDFQAGAAYHLALAEAYASGGRTDLVPRALAPARVEAAGDPQVLERVAELYVVIGDFESAIPVIEEAAAAAPEDAALQARLGALFDRLGLPDRSRAAYEQAARLGSDPVALLELARLKLSEGHGEEARDLLLQVTQAKPLNAEAYLLLGDAERQLGREKEAIDRYQHASQLTSQDTPIGREVLSRLTETGSQAGAAALADREWQQYQAGEAARQRQAGRPGCITVYVLLLGLSSIMSLCGLASLATGLGSLQDPAFLAQAGIDIDVAPLLDLLPLWIGAVAISVVVQIALAVGLWLMKNWARIVVIVLHSITFVGLLVNLVITFLAFRDAGMQGSLLTSLAIGCIPVGLIGLEAFIIFWFVTNRRRFS